MLRTSLCHTSKHCISTHTAQDPFCEGKCGKQNMRSVSVTTHSTELPNTWPPSHSRLWSSNHSHAVSTWANYFKWLFISLGNISASALETHSAFMLVSSCKAQTCRASSRRRSSKPPRHALGDSTFWRQTEVNKHQHFIFEIQVLSFLSCLAMTQHHPPFRRTQTGSKLHSFAWEVGAVMGKAKINRLYEAFMWWHQQIFCSVLMSNICQFCFPLASSARCPRGSDCSTRGREPFHCPSRPVTGWCYLLKAIPLVFSQTKHCSTVTVNAFK